MWSSLPEYLRLFGALSCTGVAVKFLDDYMDEETDLIMAKFNWAGLLGRGIYPYGLLLLALGVWLHRNAALSLFLTCYALGMGPSWRSFMPSALRGWQESVIALILGVALAGIDYMVLALGNVYFLIVFDDWRDCHEDLTVPFLNLWRFLGPVLAGATALAAVIAASLISPGQTLMVIFLAGLLYAVETLVRGRIGGREPRGGDGL